MLKDDLIEQYEEIMIKLAICSAMEIEGEELIKEMEEMKSYPKPSPQKVKEGLKGIYKAYNKQCRKARIKKNIRIKMKMFCKILLACLISIVLFFILKEDMRSQS